MEKNLKNLNIEKMYLLLLPVIDITRFESNC